MKNKLAITAIEDGAPRAPLLLRGEPVAAVHQAAALGYEAIEIHVVEAGLFPTAAVREACQQTGVGVSAIVTGQIYTRRKLCITSADEANREAAMRELYAYIDIAAELGTADGIVIGWIKGNRPEGKSEADTYDELLARQLQKLGGYAAARGQRILIEVINRYETNVFNTSAELVAFLEYHQLENTYVHLDTFHMNIEEADMAAAIRTAGSRLGYIHFADSNREYPGAGHLDFASILRALEEIAYSGALSVECIPLPDSQTAARAAKAQLDKLVTKGI